MTSKLRTRKWREKKIEKRQAHIELAANLFAGTPEGPERDALMEQIAQTLGDPNDFAYFMAMVSINE